MNPRRAVALLAVASFAVVSLTATAHAQGAITTSCTTASGHHIYEDARVCPVGGGKYTALQLGTHSTYGSNLDLSRVSYLNFPIAVPVCPGNGFVDFKGEYTPAELEAFTAAIGTDAYKALLGKHTSYYLFARMIEISGVTGYDQWWLDNVAASEAASCHLPVFDDYIRRAKASSDAALSGMPLSDENYWPLQLLNINQLREIGEFDAASARLGALTGIPDDWKTAIDTLREAVARKVQGRVEIGHKFNQ